MKLKTAQKIEAGMSVFFINALTGKLDKKTVKYVDDRVYTDLSGKDYIWIRLEHNRTLPSTQIVGVEF